MTDRISPALCQAWDCRHEPQTLNKHCYEILCKNYHNRCPVHLEEK